jgi:hypothetical protein
MIEPIQPELEVLGVGWCTRGDGLAGLGLDQE